MSSTLKQLKEDQWEGERCAFLSQRKVMYGAGNQWAITVATNGVDCSNSVFMDPAPNVAKKCYFFGTPIGFVMPTPSSPKHWPGGVMHRGAWTKDLRILGPQRGHR